MVDNRTREYIQLKSSEFMTQCPWFGLRKASRVATQLSNSKLHSSGIRITQLCVLVAIAQGQPILTTELAAALVMDHTTLSHSLKPLKRDGLIEVNKGKEDKRTREISLTPAGEELLAEALPLWEEAKAAIDELFGMEQVNMLLEMVETLSEFSFFED
jgi:DNA-binding MarR family transcriptional regulator